MRDGRITAVGSPAELAGEIDDTFAGSVLCPGLIDQHLHRRTAAGRVAGADQRISVHEALRALTIEAAHPWRLENDLGSIEAGKVANFTVLAEDPYAVDPVFQGRWFPRETATRRI